MVNLLYLTEAPDEEKLGPVEIVRLFESNILVFRLQTRRLEVAPHRHAGFSIKTVFRGLERYNFEDREAPVAAGEVLLVSPLRPYSSSIRTSEPTDSFSIFFPHSWVEARVSPERLATVHRLLDSGASSTSLPVGSEMGQAVRELARALAQSPGDKLAGEEALTGFTRGAFAFVEQAGDIADRIDAAQPATRLELLRRVSRVRDLLESRVQAGVSLAELAKEACLSEFHLLRVFKQAFGTTPARYLERRRMNRAHDLLLRTDLPIADVAASCGYSNLSAFGRAFCRAWGNSATLLRAQQANWLERRPAE